MEDLKLEKFSCPNCQSNDFKIIDNIVCCKYCLSKFTKKQINSQMFVDLRLANIERNQANFDKAKTIYSNIIKNYPNEDLTDVYWGLFLCEQRVLFEEDGKGEKFPSFYRLNQDNSIEDSLSFGKALSYALKHNKEKLEVFNNLAEKIENARKMYLDIKNTTEPFDIFICFKNKDDNGNYTNDRQLAMDIYNEFSDKYNIFFSEKTLKNIKSNYREYEPNIYYGLYTAKVMLLLCSKTEYLESKWLKNEWNRFSSINKQGTDNKCIIPIFTDNFNPNDLPESLWHNQGIFDDRKLISTLQTQLENIIHPVDKLEALRKEQEEQRKEQEERLKEQEKQRKEQEKKLKEQEILFNQKLEEYKKIILEQLNTKEKDINQERKNTNQEKASKQKNNPLYARNNNVITFGSYPQTRITDNSIINPLDNKAGTLPTSSNSYAWTDYGYYVNGKVESYMWYIDLEYNNNKYRGVYFTKNRPDYTDSDGISKQSTNGYSSKRVYWFKYEPIKWTIKEESNGYAIMVCDIILDSQDFNHTNKSRTLNGKTIYANNYVYKHIRSWLNNTFYNTAFNKLEQAIIQTTIVDNSASTTNSSSNEYACNNTSDKVYLLSYQEAIKYFTYDSERQKKGTDYAKCQGLNVRLSGSYSGNSYWWLRSPNNKYGHYSNYIYDDGNITSTHINYTYIGVLPALKITL